MPGISSEMKSELNRHRRLSRMKRANLPGDVARGLMTQEDADRRRIIYDRIIARTDAVLGPAKEPDTKKPASVSAAKKPSGKKAGGTFSREASEKRQRAVGEKIPGISGILNLEEIAKRGREKKANQ